MKRSSYREALEKYGEFVRLSKQLATDSHRRARAALSLDALRLQEPDAAALRELYGELGFTSLLREIAPLTDDRKTDYAALDSPAALEEFLRRDSARPGNGRLALARFRGSGRGRLRRARSRRRSLNRSRARRASLPTTSRIKTLAAMSDWLADPKRPKIVHDPKLFHLLAASGFRARLEDADSREFATR